MKQLSLCFLLFDWYRALPTQSNVPKKIREVALMLQCWLCFAEQMWVRKQRRGKSSGNIPPNANSGSGLSPVTNPRCQETLNPDLMAPAEPPHCRL
jgi:hypothetical protein